MNFNARRVKEDAIGRWLEIFHALAPSLDKAIQLLGHHVPCPVHGGVDGFRLFPDAAQSGAGICNTCGPKTDGFALLAWVNGWSFSETVNAVGNYLSNYLLTKPSTTRVSPKPSQVIKLENGEDKLRDRKCWKAIHAVWNQSVMLNPKSVCDGVKTAIRYIKNRGLDVKTVLSYLDKKEISVIEDLPYWEVENDDGKLVQTLKGRFTSLVCQVRDPNGFVVTLHRTYLSKDGWKANVAKPKKLMCIASSKSINGAAIRLSPVKGEVLAVAEGVETALSVMTATGLPCWSVICANGLRSFVPPRGVKRVVIYADNDRSGVGVESAKTLARRLRDQGISCSIFMPRKTDSDWNDVLRSGGKIPG